MSVLPPTADIGMPTAQVRFVPEADITNIIRPLRRR
jgi:hypothetical protein